jgi:hypothetical protein
VKNNNKDKQKQAKLLFSPLKWEKKDWKTFQISAESRYDVRNFVPRPSNVPRKVTLLS